MVWVEFPSLSFSASRTGHLAQAWSLTEFSNLQQGDWLRDKNVTVADISRFLILFDCNSLCPIAIKKKNPNSVNTAISFLLCSQTKLQLKMDVHKQIVLIFNDWFGKAVVYKCKLDSGKASWECHQDLEDKSWCVILIQK